MTWDFNLFYNSPKCLITALQFGTVLQLLSRIQLRRCLQSLILSRISNMWEMTKGNTVIQFPQNSTNIVFRQFR